MGFNVIKDVTYLDLKSKMCYYKSKKVQKRNQTF